MPEHCSLLYHKMGFLPAQHQLFPDTDLQNLGQVSKIVVEVVSIDGEVIHENFQAVAKKVREDSNGRCTIQMASFEAECVKRTCEHRLLLIVGMDCNLVLARISIPKAKVTRSCPSV